jgi:hypothetical protein
MDTLNDIISGLKWGDLDPVEAHDRVLALFSVSKSLPDHYAGELNTKRIKAYRLLHEKYNLEEGTVRDIFCEGADWYKKQCQEGNVC